MRSYRVFSVADVKKAFPGMNLMNLIRWQKKGRIVKIRNGWYSFKDTDSSGNINWLAANLIYAPSYISLQSALSYYGMIPEPICGTTSVTTRKANHFMTHMGSYSYHRAKQAVLDFGQTLVQVDDNSNHPGKGRKILMAEPEKALLDLLYINNQYNTEKEMENLMLDETRLENILNEKFYAFLDMYANRSLEERVRKMRNAYAV